MSRRFLESGAIQDQKGKSLIGQTPCGGNNKYKLRLIEANGQLRGTAMPPGEKKKHSQRELVES